MMIESFFTADQLVAHLVGDYLLQSHWMAQNKTKSDWAAGLHAFTYTLPFMLVSDSYLALCIIAGSHALIDRYRLARYLVWFKNGTWLRPWINARYAASVPADPVGGTGYPADTPAWLAVWLLIIADNTIHILVNGAAIALGAS